VITSISVSAQEPKEPAGPDLAANVAIDETVTSSMAPRRRLSTAPGDVLVERYEVIDEVGRGAFGVVYRAHDRVADTTVAIKVLTSASARSVETVARLRRELRAAWKVTHPGVVRVHDLIDLGNRLALLMEFVDGETLDKRLLRTRLRPAELEQLALDLSRALGAAHRAGVTHRDLKPSNIIMRQSTGRPVITDFGLSLIPGVGTVGDDEGEVLSVELTRSGGLCGTPRYMAPEQLAGQSDVGPAADVYALGLVLFEAATGQRPFSESTLAGLKEARQARPAPPVASVSAEVPPQLARVIDRCLLRDASARFPSAVEVRAALEQRDQRDGEAEERRRWRQPLIALAGVTVAAVGSFFVWTALADRLPRSDRRLAFTVSPDDELGRAVAAMAQHRLKARDRRVRVVTNAAEANVQVRLDWRRLADGSAAIDIGMGRRAQHLSPLGTVQARAVSDAIDEALVRLRARVDVDQLERPPSDDERALAAAAAAPDLQAWRSYDEIVSATYSELIIDVPTLAKRTQALVERHPTWLHPYAQLINTEGNVTPAAQATLQAAHLVHDSDPTGRLMVAAAAEQDVAKLDKLIPELDRRFAAAPRDVLLGWLLYGALHTERRVDESVAVLRSLNHTRPDLQFGSDLEQELRRAGRGSEVPALQQAWLAAAPDNQQALASQIVVDLDAGQRAKAEAHARDLLFLHGPSPQRLVLLCEVLIITGELREASSLAEELLRGNDYERGMAWFHLGQIALLQGRSTAALEAWLTGVEAARPYGVQGALFQTLEELASTAAFVHAERELDTAASELVRLYTDTGDRGQAMAWSIELEAHRARAAGRAMQCLDLEAELRKLPPGAGRGSTERELVRAAAAVDCAPCARAVRLGLAPVESNVRSLLQLGLCAEKEGQLALAADVLARAQPLRELGIHDGETPSTVSSLLAEYHLARVLERLGRHDEAQAHYEAFLARWDHADHAIAEVEEARQAAR
jgi:tetratricopeptide (TPR) repeat protein